GPPRGAGPASGIRTRRLRHARARRPSRRRSRSRRWPTRSLLYCSAWQRLRRGLVCKPRTRAPRASGHVFGGLGAPNGPLVTHLCRGAPAAAATIATSARSLRRRIDRIRARALAGRLASLLRSGVPCAFSSFILDRKHLGWRALRDTAG